MPIASIDSRSVAEALLRGRLGHDPGTLNFLYPYARFMEPVGAADTAFQGWRTTLQHPTAGVMYVHVPFCPAHCPFCGFGTTYGLGRDRVGRYLRALAAEAASWRGSLPLSSLHLDSLFVGGGTPNYLRPAEFVELVATLRRTVAWDAGVEFTVEIYPSPLLTNDLLPELVRLGVTRVSLCAQDFNDDVLARSGRLYSGREALEVGRRAADLGFAMNVDLMIGIPGQTGENSSVNLQAIEQLQPAHVTLNPFSNRSPAIPLHHPRHRGELTPIDGIRCLYETYRRQVLSLGYRQSGKCNFERLDAAPFIYEQRVRASMPRLGLGLNALSFNGRATYRNAHRLDDYERRAFAATTAVTAAYELYGDDLARAHAFYEILDGALDVARVRNRFGPGPAHEVEAVLDVFARHGLATREGQNYAVTEDGLWNTGLLQRCFLPPWVIAAVLSHGHSRGET